MVAALTCSQEIGTHAGQGLGYLAGTKSSGGLVSGAGGGNLLVRGGWCLFEKIHPIHAAELSQGSTAVAVRHLHPPSKDHFMTGFHIFLA